MKLNTLKPSDGSKFEHKRRGRGGASGLGKTGGDRLLAQRQMAGTLDQVLQEQVVGALFRFAQAHLRAVQGQAFLLADIVVQARACRSRRPVLYCRHGRSSKGSNYLAWRIDLIRKPVPTLGSSPRACFSGSCARELSPDEYGAATSQVPSFPHDLCPISRIARYSITASLVVVLPKRRSRCSR